jgi:hypothetical protein
MTIKAKDEETTSVMPNLIRYPEKTKLDYPVKLGNDKKEKKVWPFSSRLFVLPLQVKYDL